MGDMRVFEEDCYFLPVLFSVLEGREDLTREDQTERAQFERLLQLEQNPGRWRLH